MEGKQRSTDSFQGLPLESLIAQPLQAASKAQVTLSAVQMDFSSLLSAEQKKAENDSAPKDSIPEHP